MMAFNRKCEDVVISGVGGYFPKCENIEVFKEKLLQRENFLGNRWQQGMGNATNLLGTISIDNFDSVFFGVHFAQCFYLDPMHRVSLERSYEAILDAGVNPGELRGKRVAVYSAMTFGENDNLYSITKTGLGLTGHCRAMLPNRISYYMDFKGPSCAYDSNWLGGVMALQSAYEVVGSGQCDSAIAVAANVCMTSEIQWILNDMGLLSPDGITRSFDAKANGYGRTDGVIAFYIQRASDAKRSYASILGVKSDYNGYRNGVFRSTVDVNTMTNFIEDFYDNCQVDPTEVEFVECYGCGLKNYDEVELEAITRAYCKNRKDPLPVGCVKSNIGHAETTSAFFGIAKVLVAFETGIIPANVNFDTPNPNIIGLKEGRIEVVSENRKCNLNLAAINAVGLSSSYAHILLRANSKVKTEKCGAIPRLINISTRTEEGIQSILTALKSEKKVDPEYVCLIQDTFKRPFFHHLHRGFAIVGMEESKSQSDIFADRDKKVWFVYSGMGSQWCKMATDLMALPVFAKAIYKCHKVLELKGVDLIHIVSGDDEKIFDNILNSFVGIAAIQIALTDVLFAIGIVPDGIIGHSVGELGCAYADGCLSAEQMMLCAYSRGKASLEANLIKGMMAAVGMGYQQIKDQLPPNIEVACHNGPDSSTISGPAEDMRRYVDSLTEKQIFARLVNVADIAYHSRYIKEAAPLLLKYLKEIIPQPLPRSSKWISTSVPNDQWDTDLAKTSSAEYHTNNLLSSVLFEEGSKNIPQEAVVIEIAPHGLLQAILKRSLSKCVNIPLTRKTSTNSLVFLLEALGRIYLSGVDMNLTVLYPKIDYPVSRGTKSLTPLVHWEHTEMWGMFLRHTLRNQTALNQRHLQMSLENKDYVENLIGHELQTDIVIPTSVYLGILYDILCIIIPTPNNNVVLENINFKNIIIIPKTGSVNISIIVQKGSGNFEITSDNDSVIATGTIRNSDEKIVFTDVVDDNSNIVNSNALLLTGTDVYSEFYHRKYNYSGNYKLIKNLNLIKEGSVSTIKWNNDWKNLTEAMIQQSLFYKGECNQNTLVVTTIRQIVLAMAELEVETTDIQATYSYINDIISAKGIQISGIAVKPLESFIMNKFPVLLQSVKQIQLTDTNNQENMENVINASIKICMDNFGNGTTQKIIIIEVQSENPSLQSVLQNTISACSNLKAVITTVKDFRSTNVLRDHPVCVVINDTANKECIDFLISSNAFLLAQSDANILGNFGDIRVDSNITVVAKFAVDNVGYSIMRMTAQSIPIIMPIKVDSVSCEDFSQRNLLWVTKLRTTARLEKDKRIYLVFKVIPFEGIYNFVKKARCLPEMDKIRFVFALDKNGLEFSINEPKHHKILKNDLVLTVIQNGSVNSYLTVPRKLEEEKLYKSGKMSNLIGTTLVEYIGINIQDETLILHGESKPELGCIDYSGVAPSGKKLMGLAELDTKLCKLVPDPILTWDVPRMWSLEDAATIPYAHVIAYYALVIIARVQSNESVLVHNACTPYGLACIFLASKFAGTVFATVTSDVEKAFLHKRCCFINKGNIFLARNTSFEPQLLLASQGEGVQIILNCTSGTMLDASIRCIAEFGKFIHLGELDLEENKQIGMRQFLKNVGFASVSIKDVFNARADVKQKIREYIATGLETYVVRPLPREIVNQQDIKSTLRKAKETGKIGKTIVKLSDNLKLSQLNITSTGQYVCNPKNSYLVYGGNSEMWIDVLEWLIYRGARKIIVSSQEKPKEGHICRRLKLYQTYYNAEIIFSTVITYEENDIFHLLSEVYKLAPIEAVFILPMLYSETKENIKTVEHLNSTLKVIAPKVPLINFVNSAASICQLRNDAGFLGYNIYWEDRMKFSNVLYALDYALECNIKEILINETRIKNQESAQSLYDKLGLLFPNSIEEIKNEVMVAPKNPDFIQLPSLSIRKIKEVPPVFVIPGMFNSTVVENLAKNILYPVYCASFPITPLPITTIAVCLAKKIKVLCPEGPYNILGVSYGSLIATEIAKILEKDKNRIQLQLLDGAPDTIQGTLKYLGDKEDRELGFLYHVLHIRDSKTINEASKLANWEARLKLALAYHKCTAEDKQVMIDALTTLKRYLYEVSGFQPSGELISNQIGLLRPIASNKNVTCGQCDLSKYCPLAPELHLVNGNHISILKEKRTAKIVNNKVICY